jgi:hypothetical protein
MRMQGGSVSTVWVTVMPTVCYAGSMQGTACGKKHGSVWTYLCLRICSDSMPRMRRAAAVVAAAASKPAARAIAAASTAVVPASSRVLLLLLLLMLLLLVVAVTCQLLHNREVLSCCCMHHMQPNDGICQQQVWHQLRCPVYVQAQDAAAGGSAVAWGDHTAGLAGV